LGAKRPECEADHSNTVASLRIDKADFVPTYVVIAWTEIALSLTCVYAHKVNYFPIKAKSVNLLHIVPLLFFFKLISMYLMFIGPCIILIVE